MQQRLTGNLSDYARERTSREIISKTPYNMNREVYEQVRLKDHRSGNLLSITAFVGQDVTNTLVSVPGMHSATLMQQLVLELAKEGPTLLLLISRTRAGF